MFPSEGGKKEAMASNFERRTVLTQNTVGRKAAEAQGKRGCRGTLTKAVRDQDLRISICGHTKTETNMDNGKIFLEVTIGHVT